MRFTALRLAAAVALLGASCMARATPVTLGFEGVTTDLLFPATPYAESGFTLTNLAPNGFNDGIFAKEQSNSNGSATFVFCAYDSGCASGTAVRLTGTTPFALKSLEVGTFLSAAEAGTLEITGFLQAGGTVTTTVNVKTAWATQALRDFTDLLSVEFRGHKVYAVAFDNLVLEVDRKSQVPEPGSLALAGLATAGLGLSRRRRA